MDAYASNFVFKKFYYGTPDWGSKPLVQDCINGLHLLFRKCERVEVYNVHCKSKIILDQDANARILEGIMEECLFEHPDFNPRNRVTVYSLYLSNKYTSKLFNFEQTHDLGLA